MLSSHLLSLSQNCEKSDISGSSLLMLKQFQCIFRVSVLAWEERKRANVGIELDFLHVICVVVNS